MRPEYDNLPGQLCGSECACDDRAYVVIYLKYRYVEVRGGAGEEALRERDSPVHNDTEAKA